MKLEFDLYHRAMPAAVLAPARPPQDDREERIAAHARRVAAEERAIAERAAKSRGDGPPPADEEVAVVCAYCESVFYLTPRQYARRWRTSQSGRLFCGQACNSKANGTLWGKGRRRCHVSCWIDELESES